MASSASLATVEQHLQYVIIFLLKNLKQPNELKIFTGHAEHFADGR